MRAMKIIAKVLGWTVLSVLMLVVATLLMVVVLGRTDWGHRKILSVALPEIQKQLAGHLKIGHLGGDLTHGLVLYDVEIDDVEHQPAVKLKALTVHYNLLGLTHHTIDLTELKAEEAWVHARVMKDGQLNLATLAKPSDKREDEQKKSQSGYKIRLGKVLADLEARYDQPARGGRPAQHVHAEAHLDAHALIDGGKIEAGLNELALRTMLPLRAELHGKGGVKMDNGAIAADKLELTLATDGAELRKLLPDVKLRGKWNVAVKANGPADTLAVSLVAQPPAGKLAVDAQVKTVAGVPGQPPKDAQAIAWSATINARGIDPGAAVAGVPHGDVRVDASGRGRGAEATVDLKGLVAEIAGTHVDAHGNFNTDGDATVMANVSSKDLSKLRSVGLAGVGGRLDAKARVEKTTTHMHVDVDASGQYLAYAGNRIGKLDMHVHERDFLGEAHVAASGIKAAGLMLDTFKTDVSGSPKAVKATVAARGPDKTSIDLLAHGVPTVVRHHGKEGVKIVGADITLDKLAFARHGQAWASTGPATVKLHEAIEVAKLELASGAQHLGLDARFDKRSQALAVNLRAQKLDIKELSQFAKPTVDLPKTSLDLEARVRGTTSAPIAQINLDGYSERSQRLGLNKISYKLSANYGHDRASAEFVISALDEAVKGKLDVPTVLTGTRPLSVEIAATNILMAKLRKVMPPMLANLEGRLDGNIKASGTTTRPVLAVTLHGKSWDLGPNAKNNDVQLKVDYKERALSARADIKLQQSVGKNAGALSAQVDLPLDLSLATLQHTKKLVEQLEHKTPIAAVVNLQHLDLGKFPFEQLGMAPPLTAGMVEGSIKLRGTLHEPQLDADLEGHQLAKGKLDKIDLFAELDYANKRASLKVDGSLRGSPLVKVRGEVPIDFQKVIDHEPYAQTPIKVDVQVPGYDLARVQDLAPKTAGRFDAKAELRGTIGAPVGKVDAAIAGLNLGATKYDKLELHAAYDGAKATAKLDAHEVKGGLLKGDATVPMDPKKPLLAVLQAKGFYIDVENIGLTNPRLLKGTLNASIEARGPRTQPTVNGYIKFSDGQLALAADARVFQDVKVDVAINQNGAITLKEAGAKVGEGAITATGTAQLAGFRPQRVDIKAEAKKFPIPTGTFGAWLDAVVTIHGEDTGEGMSGTVTVEKGTANLPKLAGGKKLQSTGPLEDVKFVDPVARRAEIRKKEAEEEAPTTEIVARIPGPFHVRSKELSTDLKGHLTVQIAGPVARITGQVQSLGGWMELLGRRYTLEKVRVGFAGEAEPNPELDIRLTREISDARIIIEVHGTAKKPQVILESDPPIYDQSQVIAIIISGDPSNQRVDDRSLDQKVTGAVSSLLVGKLKDQIAPNLPIDVIKVDTGTEGSTGLGDTRVEVGKYVTDNVYVSYVHQFGSSMVGTQRVNSNEANVDWRFKKHYDVETAFGDAAVGRVNLYWTVRY
ncbi:MAG: hypothetical protein JWN44_7022 [Myxococcales bacterium]|nr:hypothetical protein [Myxococcales bacterium]